MSKYDLGRLGSTNFEHLCQALLESRLRLNGKLIQFGPGPDGGREATWTQPVEHHHYTNPSNGDLPTPKQWIFQAKFHDATHLGWSDARKALHQDLESELQKVVTKYALKCHKYVLMTNVPLTGTLGKGSRDRIEALAATWKDRVPEIEIWDGVDLSRMLDADHAVRNAYLDSILPGDVLAALLRQVETRSNLSRSKFIAYLRSLIQSEREAKAEEAGDESRLSLSRVFIDLDLTLRRASPKAPGIDPAAFRRALRVSAEGVPASRALLQSEANYILLKGGPGVGKSTITQFLTLYHAARLAEPSLAYELEQHLSSEGEDPKAIDHASPLRVPFRVELRRYAVWIGKQHDAPPHLAIYIAESFGRVIASSVTAEDVYQVVADNPTLLLLDGLDEVPNAAVRDIIFDELQKFLLRCNAESCHTQVIVSTRPQGYRGEVDGFDHVEEWFVEDLSRQNFDLYCKRWLGARLPSSYDEREEAHERIASGMKSKAVQQLARSLLQATVMLTIVKKKHQIPHARHKLYQRYVEVVFEREQGKRMVRQHAAQLLRLHELVGYRLMERLDSEKESGPLSANEFALCLHDVIDNYGDELRENSYSELRREITVLATDRLCLLAGTGDAQKDVDFVIQPFREYFAAAYLTNHEEASVDKVYSSLSLRSNVWLNVLQFYCAFRSVSEQRAWALEAAGRAEDWRGEVEKAHARRTLLSVMPEFRRAKNRSVRRVLEVVFDRQTRWIWFEQRLDLRNTLDVFIGVHAFQELSSVLRPLSLQDPHTLAAEAHLLCSVANEPEAVELLHEFLGLGRAGELVAIRTAADFDLPLDLSAVPIHRVLDAIPEGPRFVVVRDGVPEQEGSRFENAMSDALRLELLFRGRGSVASLPDWLSELRDFVSRVSLNSECGELLYILDFKFGPRSRLSGQTTSRLLRIGTPLAVFVAALVEVLERRSEQSLRTLDEARDALGKGVPDFLLSTYGAVRCEPPSDGSDACRLFLKELSFVDASWLSLFVEVDAWDVFRDVCGEEKLSLLRSLWAKVPDAERFAESLYYMRTARNVAASDHVSKSLRIVLDLVSERGVEVVRDLPMGFADTFALGEQMDDQIDLNSIANHSSLLSLPRNWSTLALFIVSSSKEISSTKLLELWKRSKRSPLTHFIDSSERRIEELISLGSSSRDAVTLAANFAAIHSRRPDRMSRELSVRTVIALCELIKSSSIEELPNLLRLLRVQKVCSPVELEVWSDPDVWKESYIESWWYDDIARRVLEFGLLSARPDVDQAKSLLGKIIRDRSSYPREIVLGSLSAFRRLAEGMMTPLGESDWLEEDVDGS